ncbi:MULTISPECIES: CoA ester lyase [unclassified Treponema]|uniref:HpcH/HpaI aldolase/citrate lyase family protein n=1 Tax=unclassified Treponema TaxID=2638727 RepID=UPI0020A358A6|nr:MULTISPECIES: CoA ester lyase [unclassified Treponema]UTC68020.1 CoA ester lyase [Treponema sp. OMZ 789]UTC70742.1 CoA ester lyase [Treponema sp. OMZ 790]UTC73462.1 CoA ester lyase [Treponema sp. OMZ 791]
MKNRRSMLFMPGNNPGMLVSADILGADSIIYDLEDAVSLDEKDSARTLVRNALSFLKFTHSEITVRINPIDSPYWEKDLEAIIPVLPDGIVIPKASVDAVHSVEQKINEIKSEHKITKDFSFLMLVESARGIMDVNSIAKASPLIQGLLLGGEDYSVDMGIQRTRLSKELEYARFSLTTAAHAYGLDSLDTPFTDVEDFEGLRLDTAFSKSIGFSGRLVINPRQVEEIHKIFSPSAAEIERAQAILQAAEEAKQKGLGVFSFKGKMVDLPVIKRAQALYDSAKNWGLIK